MWLEFFLALPVFALMLYLPGYLIARSLTSDFYIALAAAPLVSSCAYSLLGIVYEMVGIYTWWLVMVVPVTLAGVVCLLISRYRGAPGTKPSTDGKGARWVLPDELSVYLPYVIFGVIICLFNFIKPLDGPASFVWRTDMCQHLNLIARFVNTGEWSMLHASIHADPAQAAITSSSYYPASWHILVCLVVSALGCSVTLASNVVNAFLIGFTLPTSSYLLVRTALGDKPLAVRLGAIFPLAFGNMPWRNNVPDGRYPFTTGLMFAIVCVALFVTLCEDISSHKVRWEKIVLTLVCFAGCALMHPSCIFSAGALLAPYLVWLAWRYAFTHANRHPRLYAVLASIGCIAVIAAVWFFCYHIPMVNAMGNWSRYAYTNRKEALLRVVFMGFKDLPAQPWLALPVWIGVVYSLYRKRYLWLTGGFAFFSFIYFVCATSDGRLKSWLATFWYNDFNRIAASACVIAVPLAALGLFALVRVAQACFRHVSTSDDKAARRFCSVTVPLVSTVVLAMAVYYPSYHLPHEVNKVTTAFGYVRSRSSEYNKLENNFLAPDEVAFLEEVEAITGDDLVLNFPFDGSCYAYATNDVNVYVRRFNSIYFSQDAKYLNGHLNEIATDDEVTEIVHELGVQYVLLLDIDETAEYATIYEDGYGSNLWMGLTELDDDTPGFEVVLSEGDMRLYRILDEAA